MVTDSTDQEISAILQQVYRTVLEGHDPKERNGYIRRSTFFAAAGIALPRAKSDRTRWNRWDLAHERRYLTHGAKEPQSRGPVIMYAGTATVDWDRSQVRPDIWARRGQVQEDFQLLRGMLAAPKEKVVEAELVEIEIVDARRLR